MGSNPVFLDGFPSFSEVMDSQPALTIYTDVSVVPEHEKSQLEQSISNLQGEILQLKLKLRSFDENRKKALNKIIDIKGGIRVFCRVRPFILTEKKKILEPISIGSENIVVKTAGNKKVFEFDKVFHQAVNQEDVFVEVEPIIRSALDGHNACILAYGQTGTGKTFTMDGTNEQPGIVPRVLEELFRQQSLDKSCSLTFSMSILEVYKGNLKDLLAPRSALRAYEVVSKCNLSIQTDSKGCVEIEGLTEIEIPDLAKAKWCYNKGRKTRSTSWTNVNEASSRSHCLTRITISRNGNTPDSRPRASKLWMVDLGGSERLLKTGATGQTLDEGRAINLSLSALGDVIATLRKKKGHVPYRNSKLTQILKDSLGSRSKVLMLVHISPSEGDIGETICSLNFTKRARAVECNRELTEELKRQKEKQIAEFEEEMREAEEECQKIVNQLQKAEFILTESKKILSTTYHPENENDSNPKTPEDLKQVSNNMSQVSEKGVKRNIYSSLPRFMTSTVASRQRQSASEKEVGGRTTSLRSSTRSSMQFSTSQSLSFSDNRFRALVQSSNKKSRFMHTSTIHPVEIPKFNGTALKTSSLSSSKMVTSSDPNLRVTLSRHRRRMSDFI